LVEVLLLLGLCPRKGAQADEALQVCISHRRHDHVLQVRGSLLGRPRVGLYIGSLSASSAHFSSSAASFASYAALKNGSMMSVHTPTTPTSRSTYSQSSSSQESDAAPNRCRRLV